MFDQPQEDRAEGESSLITGGTVQVMDSRISPCRYGDKFAVSPMARVWTVIWMLSGLVTQGLFVATVTMALVSQSLDFDFKLYGNKVGQFSKFCL